jgi:uncharacterized protein
MEKTDYCSFKNGSLSKGCQMCVKGEKLVLFITGICPRSCYFCPVSDEKYQKDVMYANERPITNFDELIEEAKISKARGCGITGGDPLVCFDKTISVIKLLKSSFENFHIHLYTSLNLVNEEKLRILEEAGLDEIRFHLDFDNEKYWEKIKLKTSMKKGVEVPSIPKKDLVKMINYIKDHVDFINLNELEYADVNHNTLDEKGFELKSDFSYAISGSEENSIKALEEFPKLNIHYCTSKLKNSVQFMNRLALRAKSIKRNFDIINGPSLIRGSISGKEDLSEMHKKISEIFRCEIEPHKKRIICSKKDVKKFKRNLKEMGYKVQIVEELASYDLFELESEEL